VHIPLDDYEKIEGISSAFLNVEVVETDRHSIRQISTVVCEEQNKWLGNEVHWQLT